MPTRAFAVDALEVNGNLIIGNVTLTASGNSITVGGTPIGTAGGGTVNFTFSTTAPAAPNNGDRWVDSNTLRELIYIYDGDSGQWIQPADTNENVIGATGIQGNVGPQGATGIQGNIGPQGATGIQGNVGPQGATGIQGNIGPQGSAGSVGATGASGPGADQLLNTNSSVTFSTLTVSSLASLTTTLENIIELTGATGTVNHNVSQSTIFFHTSIVGNFTANFVNVPTTNNRVISVVLVLQQGATPFICNAVQIDGVAQTVYYVNAASPTGTANRRETQSFSLFRQNNTWTVLGTLGSFG